MRADEQPLRLAIVGSGNIAETHAAAISLIPEARLQAVYSRNHEKAAALAALSGARVANSLDEVTGADDIDGVLIATPSGNHRDVALRAISAGKHVLCEKPLEVTAARAEEMILAAEAGGVILVGFFPLRCGEGARAIRKAIDAGRFGRLTFLSARVKWWRSPSYYTSSGWRGTWLLDGGGALMNQGIHAVDLLQWFGGQPSQAAAFAGTLLHEGIEVEDTLAATLRMGSGALATIEASTACYPGFDLSVEISGESGSAVLVNDRIQLWEFANQEEGDDQLRSGGVGGKIAGGLSDPKAISYEGHRQQILEFCRAIRGENAEIIGGREAQAAVVIVEAIYEAARTGAATSIVYPS